MNNFGSPPLPREVPRQGGKRRDGLAAEHKPETRRRCCRNTRKPSSRTIPPQTDYWKIARSLSWKIQRTKSPMQKMFMNPPSESS